MSSFLGPKLTPSGYRLFVASLQQVDQHNDRQIRKALEASRRRPRPIAIYRARTSTDSVMRRLALFWKDLQHEIGTFEVQTAHCIIPLESDGVRVISIFFCQHEIGTFKVSAVPVLSREALVLGGTLRSSVCNCCVRRSRCSSRSARRLRKKCCSRRN